MKHRKITIVAEPAESTDDDSTVLFSGRNTLLVNEVPLPHHGFCIGLEDEDGFLTITVMNVEEDAFNEFMADETPDDVLEGTGVPTYTSERSSDEDLARGPDTLSWRYGTNIVLPVHDLELRVMAHAK